MSYLYKLQVPAGAKNAMLLGEIGIPHSPDAIQMAEWWKTASMEDRISVVNAGAESGDFVAAWTKFAGEIAGPTTEKSEHDLKDVIRRAEQTNENLGDPSSMSEPPNTNP